MKIESAGEIHENANVHAHGIGAVGEPQARPPDSGHWTLVSDTQVMWSGIGLKAVTAAEK